MVSMKDIIAWHEKKYPQRTIDEQVKILTDKIDIVKDKAKEGGAGMPDLVDLYIECCGMARFDAMCPVMGFYVIEHELNRFMKTLSSAHSVFLLLLGEKIGEKYE